MEPISHQPQRITIQDIANDLGLSKATVCRALLQRARVAPETRKRVEDAAKRLGYQPDPTLRALSKHRWMKHNRERSSYRIALVEIDSHRRTVKSSDHDPAAKGAIARAAELGLEIDPFAFEEYAKSSRLGDVLFHRGYEGVLFSIRGPAREWQFPWERFSCLAISFDHPSHRLHQVCSDWFNAVSVAVEEFRARGYRRPGFLQFKRENPNIDLRTKAAIHLWREQLSAGGEPLPEIFEYMPRSMDDGDDLYVRQRSAFSSWFERERPDVVLDGGYLGYWWLNDLGYRMPEEVGYLRLRHSENSAPVYANGVDHKLHEQGRWGIDLLYNMIQLNIRGISQDPIRITVQCESRDGTTMRPREGSESAEPSKAGAL